MTISAAVPLVLVLAGIDREVLIVVIPVGRCPGILAVALLAGCRELRRLVVGVRSLVVIIRVAAITILRQLVVVIPVVTCCTTQGGVGTGKNIVAIVSGECSRLPPGVRRMAGGASGRNIGRNMIGVRCLVVSG